MVSPKSQEKHLKKKHEIYPKPHLSTHFWVNFVYFPPSMPIVRTFLASDSAPNFFDPFYPSSPRCFSFPLAETSPQFSPDTKNPCLRFAYFRQPHTTFANIAFSRAGKTVLARGELRKIRDTHNISYLEKHLCLKKTLTLHSTYQRSATYEQDNGFR